MPNALSFENEEGIIVALKGRRWEDDLDKAHHNLPEDLGPLTAVYTSVGSSTYRPFRKRGRSTPSAVFRGWASRELFDKAFAQLRDLGSNGEYRAWAIRLATHLGKEWRKELRYDLDIPRALKLVNLLAKGLCVVSPLWPDQCKTVARYIDVPLDKFSLRPLACVEELDHLNLRKASMGSVKTLDEYAEIQAAIRDVCAKAGVPPIAYDLLMWDWAHH